MTISVDEYFATKTKSERKKEPRYIAVINKNACTSCNSCASVCPVDCIYEVPGTLPSESYHQIDTTRCIGCQLCYRLPGESTDIYQLYVCPWNAIDMLINPAQRKDPAVLKPFYRGSDADSILWDEVEELGYQLYLNEEVRIRPNDETSRRALECLAAPAWGYDGAEQFSVCRSPAEERGTYLLYRTTPKGLQLLIRVYQHYPKIFMD
jgi:ferredoxin